MVFIIFGKSITYKMPSSFRSARTGTLRSSAHRLRQLGRNNHRWNYWSDLLKKKRNRHPVTPPRSAAALHPGSHDYGNFGWPCRTNTRHRPDRPLEYAECRVARRPTANHRSARDCAHRSSAPRAYEQGRDEVWSCKAPFDGASPKRFRHTPEYFPVSSSSRLPSGPLQACQRVYMLRFQFIACATSKVSVNCSNCTIFPSLSRQICATRAVMNLPVFL